MNLPVYIRSVLTKVWLIWRITIYHGWIENAFCFTNSISKGFLKLFGLFYVTIILMFWFIFGNICFVTRLILFVRLMSDSLRVIFHYVAALTVAFLFFQPGFDGQVESRSPTNDELLIKNPNFVLSPKSPTNVRIIVKYDGNKVPSLTGYRLNARTVCPEQGGWVLYFLIKNVSARVLKC